LFFWTMSIVHVSIKLLHFGSWIFFRLQVKRKDKNPICWTCPGLRLAQSGGPTDLDRSIRGPNRLGQVNQGAQQTWTGQPGGSTDLDRSTSRPNS
jgi:hypothetical protein